MLTPDDPAAHLAWRIHTADDVTHSATLEVWNAAPGRIAAHARTGKINREIPQPISSLTRLAIAMGPGGRNIATGIEVLRAG